MKPGTVKFYNGERGFGYVKSDSENIEFYVHVTALQKAGMQMLREGQKVSFDTQTDRDSGKVTIDNKMLV